MHLTPGGLPSGIPGIGEEIDRAIQHAPHSERHSIGDVLIANMAKNNILL
jgi:hypothetical protein